LYKKGTASVSIVAQLLKNKNLNVKPEDIRVFEISDTHYYQPGFTQVKTFENKINYNI